MKSRIRGMTLIILITLGVLPVLNGCRAARESSALRQAEGLLAAEATINADSVSRTAAMDLHTRQTLEEACTILMEEAHGIPKAQAGVTATLTALLDLPEGAAFSAADGRASIELRRRGDIIEAVGHCDSVSRLCRYLRTENTRRSERADSLSRELERSLGRQGALSRELAALKSEVSASRECAPDRRWAWLLAGFAAGVAVPGLVRSAQNKE